jgi:methionine-rich copper-binding protein CopC
MNLKVGELYFLIVAAHFNVTDEEAQTTENVNVPYFTALQFEEELSNGNLKFKVISLANPMTANWESASFIEKHKGHTLAMSKQWADGRIRSILE